MNHRLNQILKDQGAGAALTVFDAVMGQTLSSEFRSNLIVSKLYLLESDKRFEESRALAEALAAEATRPEDERQNLRLKAAFDLTQLDRADEAVAVYDQLITQAKNHRPQIYRLNRIKATVLANRRPQEAFMAWESARSQVVPGSEDWLDVEIPRLRALRRLERFEEALRGFDAVLSMPKLPEIIRVVCRADKSLTLSKQGRREEALALVAQVEVDLSRFDEPEQVSTVQFVRTMLDAARRGLDPAKP